MQAFGLGHMIFVRLMVCALRYLSKYAIMYRIKMASMEPRELTPEEMVVANAIILQRGDSWGDVFKYDFMKAQKYFAENGDFAKYGLDFEKQLEIINRLSDERIIDVDYIVDVEWENKNRAAFTPDAKLIKSDQKLFWAKQTGWSYEILQLKGRTSIEEVYAKNGRAVFVKMSIDDASNISDNYMASHVVRLELDKNHVCLCIKIDGDVTWRRLSHMQSNRDPFRILCYARKHPNKVITRDNLKKASIDIGDQYLKSQVFAKNRTVQALHPLLIRLGKDSIMFITGPVQLTLANLNKLKAALKLAG